MTHKQKRDSLGRFRLAILGSRGPIYTDVNDRGYALRLLRAMSGANVRLTDRRAGLIYSRKLKRWVRESTYTAIEGSTNLSREPRANDLLDAVLGCPL